MFDGVTRDGGAIRARFATPRAARPFDLVLLTDEAGRILDVAAPGRPAANSVRLGRGPEPRDDEVAFAAEDAPHAFYLYAPYQGVHISGGPFATARSIAEHVARLNAPFLAPSAHPACAPEEAVALGLAPADAILTLHRDLLQAEADPDDLDQWTAAVTRRETTLLDLSLTLAAGPQMAETVLGRLAPPAVSAFRARVTHVDQFGAHRRPQGRAETAEEAFRALGLRCDPALWRPEHYDALLRETEGRLADFVKVADPLSLICY